MPLDVCPSCGQSLFWCGESGVCEMGGVMEKFEEIEEYLDGHVSEFVENLRRFFLHERDQELGRWRWPEDPRYVVKPAGDYVVAVMNEAEFWQRSGVALGSRDLIHFRDVRDCQTDKPLSDAAAGYKRAAWAFWDSHPELKPKPWHDAKPGEVWELSFNNGDKMVALVTTDECFLGAGQELTDIGSTVLSAGRRIWPEVS